MPELDFKGRVVIVTGAAGDLGQAYCRYFAGRGARLVVNARKQLGIESRAEAVAAALREAGGVAVADENDLDEAGAAALIETAFDNWGRVDVLIANAGANRFKPLVETSVAEFRASMESNFWSAILPVMAALPRMLAAGYGRILLTSSAVGLFGRRDCVPYCSAKSALIGVTRGLSFETAKQGITVNAISPYARTGMSRHAIPETLDGLMSPDQVARFVAWLTHETCNLTGQLFSVGGGRVRRAAIVEGPVHELGDALGMEDFATLDLPALSPFTESRNSGQSALALVPELAGGA